MTPNATYDAYITQAEQTAAGNPALTVEMVLTSWDAQVPDAKGIVNYWKQKQNGSAIPMPSSVPVPIASGTPPGRELSSYAKNMLLRLAENFKAELPVLENEYWENYDGVKEALGLVGQALEEQVVLWVQTKLHNKATGFQEGSYSFIPIQVLQIYEAEDTKEQPKPGFPNEIVKVKVKGYRANIYGLFSQTKDDGTTQLGLGDVTCWTEEAAKAIAAIQPWNEYSGVFEGRRINKYFQLSLNKNSEFSHIRSVTSEEILPTMVQLARESGLVFTPHQVPNQKIRAKGQTLIVEGRIGASYTTTAESGKPMGKVKLTEPHFTTDEPKPVTITFFQRVAGIYDYAEGSQVMIVCRASKSKDYPVNLNAKFQIPIMVMPGKTSATPGIPAGRS